VRKNRSPRVGQHQVGENEREGVISKLVEPRRQKWSRIEHCDLHDEPHRPKNCDKAAKRPRHWFTSGHRAGVEKRQRRECNDHQDNGYSINPEEFAQKWIESGEISTPIQNARHQRARDQDRKLQKAGQLQQRFHNAPIAFMNGKMTVRTNGG